MEEKRVKASTGDFEKGLEDADKQTYVLRLYVHGQTPRSLRAIENIREDMQGASRWKIRDRDHRCDSAPRESRERADSRRPHAYKEAPPAFAAVYRGPLP
jgi:hypothetical protein